MTRDHIAEVIGYHLARLVSRNPMPHMSGDPRKRIPEHERERFDRACQEAADAIMALDGWQTIDSAPRDGTEVIVCVPQRGGGQIVAAAHWVPHDDHEGDWWWANESSGIYHASPISEDHAEPTHWRPLPQPPGDAG